jgi:hypothetical protein
METKSELSEYTLGVEPGVIKAFLELIRDKYPIVDKANFFIEIDAGASGANIAITNQRDFLSHFCTVLKDKKLTPEQQYAQVSAAEEHFRRAVIESYQKGVEIRLTETIKLFEKYKERVVPIQTKHSELAESPDLEAIRSDLDEIKQLRKKGRDAKSLNKWDDEWVSGVNAYLKAFLKIEKLEKVLEIYLGKASQISNDIVDTATPKSPNTRIWQLTVLASIILNLVLLGVIIGLAI